MRSLYLGIVVRMDLSHSGHASFPEHCCFYVMNLCLTGHNGEIWFIQSKDQSENMGPKKEKSREFGLICPALAVAVISAHI